MTVFAFGHGARLTVKGITDPSIYLDDIASL
jgi:hypothetical protein